jgi:N-acetyl-anhydromuramyl-L-alanine amidase AmpD
MRHADYTHRLVLPLLILLATAPIPALAADSKVGQRLERKGDEIVVCGQLFHTTAPVVLWMDPGGYDAYRTELRFAPLATDVPWAKTKEAKDVPDAPKGFSMRRGLSPELQERVRGGGWDLPSLQGVVDQFVIHYDVCGTSKRCFKVLHDQRGLSVQFMLDVDGTIYQTLDLKEGAWHATKANPRSVGIEIANMGAYENKSAEALQTWYARDASGRTKLTIPGGQSDLRNANDVFRPIRDDLVVGTVQGQQLWQYDLTPQQYDSLTKLTATLCTVFPKIRCDYPKDSTGKLIDHKLDDADYDKYHGVLGHFHVQTNKTDPGPAFQWDRLLNGARELIK